MKAHAQTSLAIAAGLCISAWSLVASVETAGLLTIGWGLVVSGLILLKSRSFVAEQQLPWRLLAITGFLVTFGVLARGLHGLAIGVDQPLPSWADLIHIPAYLLFILTAVTIHRLRATRRDENAWLDATIITLGAIVLLWAGFLGTFAADESVSASARALSLSYNSLILIALSVFLRITATAGHRPLSYYFLGCSGVAFCVADLVGSYGLASGRGTAIAVALSPITFGMALGAATHPSASLVATRHDEEEERIGIMRLAMISFAILTPLAVLALWPDISTLTRWTTGGLAGLLTLSVVFRVSALLTYQQRVTDLEGALTTQVSRLAALESSTVIRTELPKAIRSLVGDDRSVEIDQSGSGTYFCLPDPLQPQDGENLTVFIDGQLTPSEHRLVESLIRDASFIASSADGLALTAKLQSDETANLRIAANERRFRALVQNASDVVMVLDVDGLVTYTSDAAINVLGYEAEEFIGKTPEWIAHENDWDFARGYMQAVLAGTSTHAEHEIRARHADGSIRLLEALLTDMRHVDGIEGVVVNITDATERRALESNLRNAETTDPLTMQLNRTAFILEIDSAIRRASVSDTSVALAIINIDDFRLINEGYGNTTADQVLVELAYRIRQSVRIDDTVARLNGDEFGILMPNGYSEFEAESVVERILEEVSEPISVSGRTIAVRATAGLMLHGDGSSTGIGMLRDADTALDAAKQTNRGGLVLFEEAMGHEISERVELRNLLRDAIHTKKLRLAYQPIVDMETGEIVSMEALARWHDEKRGNIGPATFIPIAEATGMISELGEWALRTACEQVVGWAEIGLDNFTVSVNMSGHQLREENVIAKVKAILEETKVDPTRMTIEITESVLIDDTDFVAERIRALRGLGLRLAIDDFGTGYSSLSYLRRYDFDVLKVDRSFVIPLADDANKKEREIVNAMIKLAQALGAITVAEGIEEHEEFAVLRTLGCDHAQGYLFWRPLEVEDVVDALTGAPTSAVA